MALTSPGCPSSSPGHDGLTPSEVDEGSQSWRPPALVLLAIGAVWLVVGVIVPLLSFDLPRTAGEFGDMFGGTNALFSGLALGGVVWAIFLQRRDLELQQKELALTREVLKEQAEAQAQSREALAQQVKQLERSAKLSALSVLIEVANGKATDTRIADVYRKKHVNAVVDYVEQVKALLGDQA